MRLQKLMVYRGKNARHKTRWRDDFQLSSGLAMQRLDRLVSANAGIHYLMAVGKVALSVGRQRYFARRAI